jgi:hypothetical protein
LTKTNRIKSENFNIIEYLSEFLIRDVMNEVKPLTNHAEELLLRVLSNHVSQYVLCILDMHFNELNSFSFCLNFL